jgi:hypothetical protein
MYEVYRGSVRLLHGYDKPTAGYIKALERAGYEVRREKVKDERHNQSISRANELHPK